MKYFRPTLFLVAIALLFSSCSFQNIFENKQQNNITDLLTTDSTYQHVITVDDKLSVSVWNHDNMSIGSLFFISISYISNADLLAEEYELENIQFLLTNSHKASNYNGNLIGSRF
ncbi:MAG: hypothetical protein ACI93P_001986, partial [bacterium]